MEWASSLLADDAEPAPEQHKIDEQLMIQETVAGPAESPDGISSSNLQLQLDGTCLPADAMPLMEMEERQEVDDDQLQPVQSSTTGSFFPYAESAADSSSSGICGYDCEPAQVITDEQILEWGSSLLRRGFSNVVKQLLADDAKPAPQQHKIDEQLSFFSSAESAGADQLYLEQGVPTTEQHLPLPAEYQNGGDDQENLEFWRSIGFDIESTVF